MDYGQTNQTDKNQPFFTEGVGRQSVEYTDTPENDLNLTNNTTSWQNANAAPSRGQSQNIGNIVNGQLIENPNQPVNFEVAPAPEAGPDFGPAPEELGRITETEPAPATPTEKPNEYSFDESAIKIKGESLDGKAVEIISDMEKKLKQTGDAAGFVESFENAKVANLKNSYNRTFGES